MDVCVCMFHNLYMITCMCVNQKLQRSNDIQVNYLLQPDIVKRATYVSLYLCIRVHLYTVHELLINICD